jgi:hypothetical protein
MESSFGKQSLKPKQTPDQNTSNLLELMRQNHLSRDDSFQAVQKLCKQTAHATEHPTIS